MTEINWQASFEEITNKLGSINNKDFITQLRDELILHLNIANVTGDTIESTKLYRVFEQELKETLTYSEKQALVSLDQIGDDQDTSLVFRLDKPTKIHKYTQADGAPWGMYDKVYIRDLTRDK